VGSCEARCQRCQIPGADGSCCDGCAGAGGGAPRDGTLRGADENSCSGSADVTTCAPPRSLFLCCLLACCRKPRAGGSRGSAPGGRGGGSSSIGSSGGGGGGGGGGRGGESKTKVGYTGKPRGEPDVYWDRLSYVLTSLIGKMVKVQVREGREWWEGLFHECRTVESGMEIVLQAAYNISKNPDKNMVKPTESKIISAASFLQMHAVNIELERDKKKGAGQRGFATDTEISGAGGFGERELQRFEFDADSNLDLSLDSKNSGSWDQFAVNRQKFGVVSDYQEVRMPRVLSILCVCVCVFVCVGVSGCVHTATTRRRECQEYSLHYVRVLGCVCVCQYILCVCTHTHTHIHTHVSLCVFVCVCVCVCVHTHTHTHTSLGGLSGGLHNETLYICIHMYHKYICIHNIYICIHKHVDTQEVYTTKLDKGKLTKEQQLRAQEVADEIEKGGRGRADEAEVCVCVCRCVCVYIMYT